MQIHIEITKKDYSDFMKFWYLKFRFKRSVLTMLIISFVIPSFILISGKDSFLNYLQTVFLF